MKRKTLWIIVGVLIVLSAGMVLVGNVAVAHDNPPVTTTIPWDSPETEALMRAACMDCHSNETRWPWYAYVAPMAFLVSKDVTEGREEMNLSTGHRVEGHEMIEMIERGEMPPAVYLPLHPEANLTDAQKDALIAGITATFGGGRERGERGPQPGGTETGETGEAGETGDSDGD